MTRSRRNEDRGGEHRWTFNGARISDEEAGVRGETRRVRAPAGRGRHELHPGGATRSASRNAPARRGATAGTRATGRNEKPLAGLVSFHHGQTQDPPSALPEPGRSASRSRTVCVWADSIRAIARLLGRDPGTVSREVERNRNPESGGYEPCRAQQKAADRNLKRRNRARRPGARDCGTRSPPGCAGIGARSG